MTFAEFELTPAETSGQRQELHHGVFCLSPVMPHGYFLIRRNLEHLLQAGGAGTVATRLGFRPLRDFEYWIADVSFVSQRRWDSTPHDGYFEGAPELVVEVLRQPETREKKKLCLENGSKQFWVVDRDHLEVEVSTPDGRAIAYKTGQKIPLFFAPGKTISVDAIFA